MNGSKVSTEGVDAAEALLFSIWAPFTAWVRARKSFGELVVLGMNSLRMSCKVFPILKPFVAFRLITYKARVVPSLVCCEFVFLLENSRWVAFVAKVHIVCGDRRSTT